MFRLFLLIMGVGFLRGGATERISHDIAIRRMEEGDIAKGYVDCLKELSSMGRYQNGEHEELLKAFREQQSKGMITYVAVSLKEDRVVGICSIFSMRKLSHDCKNKGFIEDLVILKDYRKQNVGAALLKQMLVEAKRLGCYKTVLHCRESLEPFYKKSEFEKSGILMEFVHEDDDL